MYLTIPWLLNQDERLHRESWPRYYRKGGGCIVDNNVILLTLLYTKARNKMNFLFLVENNGFNSCGMLSKPCNPGFS